MISRSLSLSCTFPIAKPLSLYLSDTPPMRHTRAHTRKHPHASTHTHVLSLPLVCVCVCVILSQSENFLIFVETISPFSLFLLSPYFNSSFQLTTLTVPIYWPLSYDVKLKCKCHPPPLSLSLLSSLFLFTFPEEIKIPLSKAKCCKAFWLVIDTLR